MLIQKILVRFNRKRFHKLGLSLKRVQKRSLVDRSFRLANISDLLIARDYKSKIDGDYYSIYKQSSIKPRDLNKQILIDLSHQQGYRRGHIPNAINLPIDEFNFNKPIDTYDGIKEEEVKNIMTNMGLNQDTSEIILYDNSGMLACRLWFILRYFGYNNIRILNGGWRAYLRSGLPVSEGEEDLRIMTADAAKTSVKDIKLKLKNKRSYMLTRPTEMFRVYNDRQLHKNDKIEHKFIDTRRAQAFKIYNLEDSINFPAFDIMQDGCFDTVESIREYAKKKQIDLENDNLILFSSKSLSSTVAYFALSMVGADNITLYDAGIQNWRANFEDRMPPNVEEHLQR